jgi:hypothetical protein
MLLIIFFCFPETRYVRSRAPLADRDTVPPPRLEKKTFLSRLRPYVPQKGLKLRKGQFVLPSLKMAKYPSVIFPAIYYGAQYGFASILPAVTVAHIFTEFFHWDTLTIGLAYGASLTIGGFLGEVRQPCSFHILRP